MQLTPHFSLSEFTRSEIAMRRGLDNTPSPEIMEKLKRTAEEMEKVRAVLNVPIYVSSAYRGPAVNAAIGGAPTSQHQKGEAVDFVSPGFGSPEEVCRAIMDAGIVFDQLIAEGVGNGGGWVHISFTFDRSPRRQALTARFVNGRPQYSQGIA